MKNSAVRMDPSLMVGIIAGLLLLTYAIGVGNIKHFLSLQGAAIVVGGTFAALVASFPFMTLKKVPGQVLIAIRGELMNPGLYIDQIVDCAHVARKFGLLALEKLAEAQEDNFMRDSMLLIVDAVDYDKARYMMEAELTYMDERHTESIAFFERGAAFAPAFGLVGTLIGLIIMLANLGLDDVDGTATLTNGMAIALITTFYGSLLANLFFTPIASKLNVKNDREIMCKRLILEGILSIQAGENPKFIRAKLISFLPYKERVELQKTLRMDEPATDIEKLTGHVKKKKKGD